MTLTRIIRLTNGQKHSVLPVKWLTKIFVAGDLISFCLQAAGTYSFSPVHQFHLPNIQNIDVFFFFIFIKAEVWTPVQRQQKKKNGVEG
jgi:hypothetical protein